MEIMNIKNCSRGGSYALFITPGERVEIHTLRENGELASVKVFRLGDVAEYDSFNLSYIAPIAAITTKNVIFDISYSDEPRTKRLKMESFAWRNHDFDATVAAATRAWFFAAERDIDGPPMSI